MNPNQAFEAFKLELMAAYAHVRREEKARARKAVDVRRRIELYHERKTQPSL